MDLNIGDVILYNGTTAVVIDMVNFEDYSSCGYDRKYMICPLSNLQGKTIISEEEIKQLGDWVVVRGTNFPNFKKVDNIAPFEIQLTKYYKVRQKQAKQITVYE